MRTETTPGPEQYIHC